MKYQKTPTSIPEQIELLKSRGLQIESDERAAKYLTTIGYYRLTGYMYHMQHEDGSHKFKEGVSFDDIIDTYNFDKKLRYLFAAYIERIEVAMRTLLTNSYSANYGFFWYTDNALYTKLPVPEDIQQRVNLGEIALPRKYFDTHQYINDCIKENFDKATELFITKFKSQYTGEYLPPSNMAMEILSMGKISRMYDALKNTPEKQSVAEAFKIPHIFLSSWLIYLTNIRNICAHHARFWNRRTTADRFTVPNRASLKFNGEISEFFNTTLYGTLSVLLRLLNAINPQNSLEIKFKELIAQYPNINLTFMGFPNNWEEEPAWKQEAKANVAKGDA